MIFLDLQPMSVVEDGGFRELRAASTDNSYWTNIKLSKIIYACVSYFSCMLLCNEGGYNYCMLELNMLLGCFTHTPRYSILDSFLVQTLELDLTRFFSRQHITTLYMF